MRTLASELRQVLARRGGAPRVYADANIPARIVDFMRHELGWDVYFVLDDPALRRASDVEHFQLARQMHRTLVTFDRDYFDDRRFPPGQTGGIIVVSAPDERRLTRVLRRLDRHVLRTSAGDRTAPGQLPLAGRKLHAHADWQPVARETPEGQRRGARGR